MNEADTCRTYVLPKLKSSGWEDETISEQMVLTPGCIVAYLHSVQARLASLREPNKGVILQSATGEELRPFVGRTLLPSVLDRAFKGEL